MALRPLFSLTSSSGNTAVGSRALFSQTQGSGNTAVGSKALFSTIIGAANTAIGTDALLSNKVSFNVAVGSDALGNNAFGEQNVAIGVNALEGAGARTGSFNTAIGTNALRSNETGDNNTATGWGALKGNSKGQNNTANGSNALRANATGNYNEASGVNALSSNTSGDRNTAIGFNALDKNTTGSFNVALGAGAGSGVITADDVICIGRAVPGADVNGSCFIGNIRGVTTQNANALPVVIDGAGQLGTVASSERFKKDIAIMGQASEGILSLRPVTFHYKTDTTGTPQFGLIAEEVAKVNPALVLPDKEGRPYTVRYDAVNAMLLNEFLKDHRTVQEQKAIIAELKSTVDKQQATNAQQEKQIEALTAGLQRVSAQVELSKSAPQTVLNNH